MLEQIFGKPSFHGTKKLTDRVYVYHSYVNTTIILADDGVAIVDSQVNTGQVKRLVAEIKNITDLPVKYVINTHYHWDHIIGNKYFKDQGATIYANEMTRHFMQTRMKRQWRFLKGRGFSMDEPTPTLPDITFKGEMNLNLPGIALHLRHYGGTESDDATAIVMPREKLVSTGDTLLTGSFPIFGMAVMNEGLREDRVWLEVLQTIKGLQCDTLIPGHGPLGSYKDIDLMLDIQNFYIDEIEHYVNEGYSLEDMVREIDQKTPDYILKLPEVWGTRHYAMYRLYHSFTGWMDYKPTSIPWAKEEQLVKVLKECEEDEAAILKEAHEQMAKQNYGIALSLYQHLTELNDQNADYFAFLAESLIEAARTTSSILEKGDFFSLAKESIQEALEIDGNHPLAKSVKGMFMVIRAEKNGTDPLIGIELLEHAAQHPLLDDLRKAKAHLGLALGYFQTKNPGKAMQAAKTALELNPKLVPAQRILAQMQKPKE